VTAVDDPLAPLRASPSTVAVLIDFDGTLSPTVDEPDDAELLPGVTGTLAELAERFALVAVVSGRPLDFLVERLPAAVVATGLYGIESSRGGHRTHHPDAGPWREVVSAVAARSDDEGPAGMRVENKGVSLTLHYRGRPELADAVAAWADLQSRRSGLVARAAKMSVELHPPIDVDKGTTVVELCRAAGATAACYLGDDLGDLPAFDGLDRLAADGVHTVRVAVTGPEAPAGLTARADVTVEGPEGVLAFLRGLLT
jgi:trehalose 6-phosphate phosphatase